MILARRVWQAGWAWGGSSPRLGIMLESNLGQWAADQVGIMRFELVIGLWFVTLWAGLRTLIWEDGKR